jgi:hypothetical protein
MLDVEETQAPHNSARLITAKNFLILISPKTIESLMRLPIAPLATLKPVEIQIQGNFLLDKETKSTSA